MQQGRLRRESTVRPRWSRVSPRRPRLRGLRLRGSRQPSGLGRCQSRRPGGCRSRRSGGGGRPAIRHSPCILVSCWGSRGTATDQNARAARARIDLTMRDCKPRSRLSYRPEQGSPCGAAKPIALRPRPDREEGTCHQDISRIPTTRHARNPDPIDQPQETSASTRAVRLTCFSTKANVKAFASRRKTAAFARRYSRERARACSSPPHPASSLGHLTGTASRPAPNPSISFTRAGILRFSFQDVLDTALFNHMLEVFGIPRDHKPLVRIPPLLLPAPGPQADFGELAPVDVYGI